MFVPELMYEGGFQNSSEVIKLAFEHFGITPPATVYYPGSSRDISLIGIRGVDTIHADATLDEQQIGSFALLGAEAHAVDVHEWRPNQPLDAVVFINPAGIDESRVLAASDLVDGGLVLWASWSGRPLLLKDAASLELVGVVNCDEDGALSIDQEDLDAYFQPKNFQDLSKVERQDFIGKLEHYLKANCLTLAINFSYEELYEQLLQTKHPRNLAHLEHMGYAFPYSKTGTFFIFQKHPPHTEQPVIEAR